MGDEREYRIQEYGWIDSDDDHHHMIPSSIDGSDQLSGYQSSCISGVDGESSCTRTPLALDGEGDDRAESSPLGLKLSKTPSFENMIYMITRQQEQEQEQEHNDGRLHRRSKSMDEKMKAANFFMKSLVIGGWGRRSVREGDMTAKIYYSKHKIVWEFLDGQLKTKMEIDWSDITAIRAILEPDQPGILDLKVGKPPLFSREIQPEPKKHTKWKPTRDFTGGQASICSMHRAMFSPGVLDAHYEKLLQFDESLFRLSQKPFTSSASPNFFMAPAPAPNFHVPQIRSSWAATVWDHGSSSNIVAHYPSNITNNVAMLQGIGNVMLPENSFRFSYEAPVAQGGPSTSSLSYPNGNNMNANHLQMDYRMQNPIDSLHNSDDFQTQPLMWLPSLTSEEPNTSVVTDLKDNLICPFVAPPPSQGPNNSIAMNSVATSLQDNLICPFVPPPPQGPNSNIAMNSIVTGNNLASRDVFPAIYLNPYDWK